MRVPALVALEAVGADWVAVLEVGMLQRLLGGDALGRVVLEQAGQQVEPVRAGRADGRVGPVPAVLQAVLVPAFQAGGLVEVARTAGQREGLQLGVFGHRDQTGPGLLPGQAQDLDDLHHLVALEGDGLFAVHLGFLAFEDGSQREEFCEDAPHCPEVDGRRVVPTSEQKFRGAVPDGDDHLVSGEEGVERLVEQTRKTEIADPDCAVGGDEDVGRLQIPMEHPVAVQVEQAVQQLKQDRLDHRRGDGMSLRLRVVVDDLKQVVLRVLEDHEDALVLEDDLDELDHIGMRQLRTKGHLPDGGLGETRVLDQLTLLVGFEPGKSQR